ncbi:MAG: N-(5'-phosphoribosyl)anthranilate isomerase [Victivallaceae bacterium]|nr:phosphoribosylanthranilate isomerase [Victivallaceae bacterium]
MDVKICGLTRHCDAALADVLGADYLGAVLYPKSPRGVTPEQLSGLFDGCRARRVGVFVNATMEFIRYAVRLGGLHVVQLHGAESAEFAKEINFAEVWAARFDPSFPAARLVADSPGGGTGKPCDWTRASELARLRPVMLAGGLDASNAVAAAMAVRPAGLDLSSGVEFAPGIKDENKLRAFFQIIKEIEL